jgi:hypothetical protein
MSFEGARARVGGATGLAGGGVTTGAVDAAIAAAIAGLTVPATLNDLSDVSGTPTTGQVLEYDGTGWVPYTIPDKTVTVGLPLVLYDGGGVLTTGVKLSGIEIPFAATITGWTITSLISGSIVCTVNKATYAAQPTYTAISGTEKPTLSSATKNQDLTLTTWTTAVAAGDLLQISIDSATTVTSVTVNLRMTRTV